MEFITLLNRTTERIVKGNEKEVDGELICFLKENGWPPSLNKDMFIENLQNISDEKIKPGPGQVLLDLLTSTERSAIKINSEQKNSLRKIIKAIRNAHITDCKHKNLGVTIFMHGGGFTPLMPLPELICTSCGLNVTITPNLKPKNCGLKINPAHISELMNWTNKCFMNRKDGQKLLFVEEMLKNPVKVYKEAPFKFSGKLKIQIADYNKLRSVSGT